MPIQLVIILDTNLNVDVDMKIELTRSFGFPRD